jgi:23S rRNA pseudouridine1911/1915/1917 synthase
MIFLYNDCMDISILHEDTDVVAVYKPAGLVVHGDGKTNEPTLADWVLQAYSESAQVGEPWQTQTGEIIPRPGIVHRLDRETSGVLLVAKTQVGYDHLKQQFQHHQIEKEYHAFMYGAVKPPAGVINRPIGRSSKDFRMWSAQRGARGNMREAITEYKVVDGNKEYSFVHVFPKTGRTHQIRVHFKAINYPLVGDTLYAPGRSNTLGFERLALHAYSVSYASLQGEKITVTAPYPKDFTDAIAILTR